MRSLLITLAGLLLTAVILPVTSVAAELDDWTGLPLPPPPGPYVSSRGDLANNESRNDSRVKMPFMSEAPVNPMPYLPGNVPMQPPYGSWPVPMGR